jgi:uncharacterized protein YkwD
MLRRAALILAVLSLLAIAATSASAGDSRAATSASADAGALIASAQTCPQTRLDAPVAVQEQAMLCMTNFARERAGEEPLEETAALEQSAREKSRDVLHCDDFSHYACGREFTYWMRANGYLSTECWRAGENLAWGAESYGTVKSIFRAWMRSPEHRKNVLGNYTQIGIDLKTGTLEGLSGTHVWTQHFGSHCEEAADAAPSDETPSEA